MSVPPSPHAASLCRYKMKFLNLRAWRMPPNRLAAVTAPGSARIMQVQEEIAKRQILNAFGKTSDHPVCDLSNEALLVEYIEHLTRESDRAATAPKIFRP